MHVRQHCGFCSHAISNASATVTWLAQKKKTTYAYTHTRVEDRNSNARNVGMDMATRMNNTYVRLR